MAKKKSFDNIVDESFEEGYTSEPGADAVSGQPVDVQPAEAAPEPQKGLSGSAVLLYNINAGDSETLRLIWGREDRSTYYLTDLHRACIDILAYEEGIKKNDVVVAALNQYFSEKTKASARDRVVSMAVKKLKREIKKENDKNNS